MRPILENFRQVKLRYLAIALVAFLVQFAAGRVPTSVFSLDLRRVGLLVSYLLLLAFILINRRHPGILILGMGLLMNLAAILANGGLMPVTGETVTRAGLEEWIAGLQPGDAVPQTMIVLLDRSQTHLWFLSDVLSLHSPFQKVFSVGDIFVAVGILLVLVQLVLRATRPQATFSGARRKVVEDASKAVFQRNSTN